MAPYEPEDVADKETGVGSDENNNDQINEGAAQESDALSSSGSYGETDLAPSISGPDHSQASGLQKATSFVKKHKKWGIFGGGATGIIISVLFSGFLPFQLVHIKEAIVQKYSGVQVNVTSNRMYKVYGRFFFFRDADNNFAGYKGSLFEQFLTNRTNTRFVDELRSKGYGVKAEIEPSTGRWTGRFESLTFKDASGNVVELAGKDSSLWKRRTVLRQTINDLYPSKSWLWRNYRTTLLLRRYGWTRNKWWSDNAATRKLDSIEARWRSKLKSALTNKSGTTLDIGTRNSQTAEERAASDPDGETARAAGDLVDNTTDAATSEAADSKLKLDGDRFSPSKVTASSIGSGILKTVLITGLLNGACDIKRAINTIVTMSRSIKSTQLAHAALKILSLADGVKAGDADNGQTLSEAMYMINSVDPETKATFFSSGGWNFINGNSVKPTYANTYDTGGGITGTLAEINSGAESILGGGGTVQEICGALGKWYVQLGSAIAGIAVSFIPGVGQGFQAWKLASGVGSSMAFSYVLGYATTLGIKAAAGTIVDGSEMGEKFGDMLTAGSGALFSTNASNLGMRPMTTAEYAYQQQQYINEQNEELSKKSLFARYFDPVDARSLTGRAISGMAAIKYSSVFDTIASLPSMLFSPLKNKQAQAVEQYSCNQSDIAENNIQTDPFCNPIIGNTDAELDKIDPVENLLWMVDNDYVDGDGNPTATDKGKEYADYISYCFENQNFNVLFESENEYSSQFTPRCYESGDSAGSGIGLYERFRTFRLDSALLVCASKTINVGTCEDDEDETINYTTGGGINFDYVQGGDTSNVPCDSRTTDAGTATGYYESSGTIHQAKIRLCYLTKSKGTASEQIFKNLEMNSQVSGNWQSMFEDADKQGMNFWVTYNANSAYRTMDQQIALQGPLAAAPGKSYHQMGEAIDMRVEGGSGGALCHPNSSSWCENYNGSSSGLQKDRLAHIWLRDNACKYNLYVITKEAWHVQVDRYKDGSRCQ